MHTSSHELELGDCSRSSTAFSASMHSTEQLCLRVRHLEQAAATADAVYIGLDSQHT
jgi:hypothetical protein